jgi:hypothetical protein
MCSFLGASIDDIWILELEHNYEVANIVDTSTMHELSRIHVSVSKIVLVCESMKKGAMKCVDSP